MGSALGRTGAYADVRVNITEDGRAALLKLSRGDMRRALNVLQVRALVLLSSPRFLHQACHAAYESIDETAVYNCTGNPHPKDIERVVQSMMSDEFGTAFNRKLTRSWPRCGLALTPVITSLKTEKGLALQDLIAGAYDFLQTVDLPKQSRIYLLDHLGSTEWVPRSLARSRLEWNARLCQTPAFGRRIGEDAADCVAGCIQGCRGTVSAELSRWVRPWRHGDLYTSYYCMQGVIE